MAATFDGGLACESTGQFSKRAEAEWAAEFELIPVRDAAPADALLLNDALRSSLMVVADAGSDEALVNEAMEEHEAHIADIRREVETASADRSDKWRDAARGCGGGAAAPLCRLRPGVSLSLSAGRSGRVCVDGRDPPSLQERMSAEEQSLLVASAAEVSNSGLSPMLHAQMQDRVPSLPTAHRGEMGRSASVCLAQEFSGALASEHEEACRSALESVLAQYA